jgi:hypothetical protein
MGKSNSLASYLSTAGFHPLSLPAKTNYPVERSSHLGGPEGHPLATNAPAKLYGPTTAISEGRGQPPGVWRLCAPACPLRILPKSLEGRFGAQSFVRCRILQRELVRKLKVALNKDPF